MLSISFSIYDKISSWFTVKKLRKKVTNINLNILNYLGDTSLHLASYHGHQDVVQLLLDRGPDIDQKNDSGEFISIIFLCIHCKISLPYH